MFRSSDEFAAALESVFQQCDSETDVHVQMLNLLRPTSEGMVQYYYRMCALAQKDGISEAASIMYVRRGLNDGTLQSVVLCVEISTLAERNGRYFSLITFPSAAVFIFLIFLCFCN